ncbi:hypothetical protein [Actinomadura decatromicini]|uniref:Phospholipase D-like domain-containing protein n=1 Tax=Actinomadura decatromicini TaxID=2604572 RepID=A0A5D3F8R3_9ACTN|nr:hypothetical protein [Actinomadura decatromicini]TYK44603.1 hypothetical protein FXF68_34725 [Actinomadura decatromicini]
MTWEFSSPLTLLGEWRDRTDEAELHELLLLGFTVDLPFLEKTLIPTARALGARVTVIGDAGQGLYDPVDVRMAGRAYFHGLAACRGSFHPKLALLIGAHEAVAAIGSGNPTMAGWGYNDELWTVLRGHENDAPEPFRELSRWLAALAGPVSVPQYAAELLKEISARLAEFAVASRPARVLHNLDTGLLGQLPGGPIDELNLCAPFIDQGGRALARIVEHFAPSRVVLGVQKRWSSYDGDAILKSLAGSNTEVRLLAEQQPRHGKLLEWRTGDEWTALTGSANLTAAALLDSVANGGNCELGILATVPSPLLPEGTAVSVTHLRGRRTVRPVEGRPGLLVLGALLTGTGLLQVTLAHPYEVDVAVEVSPDGSPGSWTRIGTVSAGRTSQEFAVPEFAGAVVRIVDPQAGGRTESPPVFVVHPARCARRQADENRPRLRHEYTEEEIFTNEEMARRFRYDLLRLTDLGAEHRSVQPARAAAPSEQTSAVHDRYAAYLDECERTIGRPLTLKLFGGTAAPDLTLGPRWGLTAEAVVDDEAPDDPDGDSGENGPPKMSLDRKREWRLWTVRAVDRTVPDGREPAPMMLRLLVARLFVQLLAHGVWELDDDSWREPLALLTASLVPRAEDEVPDEAVQHVTAVTAVCMGLLLDGASLTGGKPGDLLAADIWEVVKERVAGAETELAEDLLIPPRLPHATVLSRSGWERLLDLARSDDPIALITAELEDEELRLEADHGIYRVTGRFTNPVPVAARVATLLGDHLETALVLAVTGGRWTFVAWCRPLLVVAGSRAMWPGWRVYRLPPSGTPAARLTGSEGPPRIGLVAGPVPLGRTPPPDALELLERVGTDPADLLRRFHGHGT